MKLKYYLRGIGIGVILTAIIMGFALGARNAPVSDAEVIEKAKGLGMVEGGVLSDYSGDDASTEEMVKEDSNMSASFEKKSDMSLIAEESSSAFEISTSDDAAGISIDEKSDTASASVANSISATTVKNSAGASAVKNSAMASAADSKSTTVLAKISDKNGSKNKDENKDEPVEAENEPADESKETPEDVSQDATPETGEKVQIVIKGGTSSDSVARTLHESGLVDDPIRFNSFLIEKHLDTRIRSGEKWIVPGSSYDEIANAITR